MNKPFFAVDRWCFYNGFKTVFEENLQVFFYFDLFLALFLKSFEEFWIFAGSSGFSLMKNEFIHWFHFYAVFLWLWNQLFFLKKDI